MAINEGRSHVQTLRARLAGVRVKGPLRFRTGPVLHH